MKNNFSTLHLRIRDRRSRRLTPARFHIERKDGTCYVAPELAMRGNEKISPVIHWRDFKENLHVCQKNERFSTHLADGEAHIPVPAEELKIYVARGPEKEAAVQTFVAKPGKTVDLEFDLDTLTDMPSQGWYSGDMHIHFTRQNDADDLMLAHLMAGEDLHAVNNMVYKHDGGIVQAPQRTMGHRGNHHQLFHQHQIIAGGEEFRDDNMYGHMIAAGISKVIEPISVGQKLGARENYPLFAQVCDWTHDQGGIAGWAHGACGIKLHESLPVEAALGKLDFIEGLQFNSFMGFYFWYRLLNCGLKMAITGGSDFPFGSDTLAPWYINLGLERTYSYIGKKKFTYPAYIDAIRHGHNFVTNGPMLSFEVNGQGPGAEINVECCADSVQVTARATSQYPLDRLEIVVNGAVEHLEDGKGGPREIACDIRVPLPESSWIAARVRGRTAPEVYGGATDWNLYAHSSPVYVHKGGKRVLQRADATWMADYIRLISRGYSRRGFFKKASQRAALQRNMDKALKFYDGLLKK